MMKLVMPFLVGLLLALFGASAMSVTNAKKVAIAVAAAKADTAKHAKAADADTAHADTAAPADTAHPGTPTVAAHDAPATSTTPARNGVPAVPTATPTQAAKPDLVVAPADQHADESLQDGRLAKIFGAMPPKEAARVLEQMNDTDVRAILGVLKEKQAAAILSALPPARAAIVTRGGRVAASTGAEK